MADPNSKRNKGVFVIYTGGTIGSMPKDPNDPESPQVVVPWDRFMTLTPELQSLGFRVECWSFPEPLDSCNIGPAEWRMMAEKIKEKYEQYEGFVILHGTDTMVYTASALSFMLVNVAKPVIITGAQRAHLFQLRNDALQNLVTALEIANPAASRIPVLPEVCIFFRDTVLRGNRCRKIDASGYSAYESPNYPHLGTAGDKIHIDERLIRPLPTQPFRIRPRMNTNVIAFDVFPGIQESLMAKRILEDPTIKGVVLRSYGSGNIPTKPEFLKPFYKATERGVVILNVTQCVSGMVELGLYETSAKLLDVGIVSGLDITPEAALCKLMVLLGDEDLSIKDVADKVQEALAGEQTLSIFTARFRESNVNKIDAAVSRVRFVMAEHLTGSWQGASIETAVIRFRMGRVTSEVADKPITLKLYADLSSTDELQDNSPNYAGSFKRLPNEEPTIFSFDITSAARALMNSGDRTSITVALAQECGGSFAWQSVEVAVFVREGMSLPA